MPRNDIIFDNVFVPKDLSGNPVLSAHILRVPMPDYTLNVWRNVLLAVGKYPPIL